MKNREIGDEGDKEFVFGWLFMVGGIRLRRLNRRLTPPSQLFRQLDYSLSPLSLSHHFFY